jgi:DNA invertase Pin-like site-specific DNA recombinase
MTTVAERAVGFRSLSEQIETTNGGKLIFRIFGALAEIERERARARQGGRPRKLSPRKVTIALAFDQEPSQ